LRKKKGTHLRDSISSNVENSLNFRGKLKALHPRGSKDLALGHEEKGQFGHPNRNKIRNQLFQKRSTVESKGGHDRRMDVAVMCGVLLSGRRCNRPIKKGETQSEENNRKKKSTAEKDDCCYGGCIFSLEEALYYKKRKRRKPLRIIRSATHRKDLRGTRVDGASGLRRERRAISR